MANVTSIRDASAWRKAKKVYVRDTTAWRAIKKSYERDGSTWRQVFSAAFFFSATITSNRIRYNLMSELTAAGWNGTDPVEATITVNSGVAVYSDTVATPAMDLGGPYPADSVINLINNGLIVGKGGDGGRGANSYDPVGGVMGQNGENGGSAGGALYINNNCTRITNNNVIAGGGGGGGGGCSSVIVWNVSGKNPSVYDATSGGGGGGGIGGANGGTRGLSNITSGGSVESVGGTVGTVFEAGHGAASTVLTVGAQGTRAEVYRNAGTFRGTTLSGNGGPGGGYGSIGASASPGSVTVSAGSPVRYNSGNTGSGGPAGYAVRATSGNSIVWVAFGTRLGAILSS